MFSVPLAFAVWVRLDAFIAGKTSKGEPAS